MFHLTLFLSSIVHTIELDHITMADIAKYQSAESKSSESLLIYFRIYLQNIYGWYTTEYESKAYHVLAESKFQCKYLQSIEHIFSDYLLCAEMVFLYHNI